MAALRSSNHQWDAENFKPQLPCPCHSQLEYGKCCRPLHLGKAAPSALVLMRSRYAAYALGLVDYIIRTTHPDNPSYSLDHEEWKKSLQKFCAMTEFIGLKIHSFEESGERAYVHFTAELEQRGQDASFSEKSAFTKINRTWLYLSGVLTKGTP